MAGILVEYARFLEVRQRRAHVASLLIQPEGHTPAEANSSAAAEEHPIEITESRREFHSDAADGTKWTP
jgi:hypothetical protein